MLAPGAGACRRVRPLWPRSGGERLRQRHSRRDSSRQQCAPQCFVAACLGARPSGTSASVGCARSALFDRPFQGDLVPRPAAGETWGSRRQKSRTSSCPPSATRRRRRSAHSLRLRVAQSGMGPQSGSTLLLYVGPSLVAHLSQGFGDTACLVVAPRDLLIVVRAPVTQGRLQIWLQLLAMLGQMRFGTCVGGAMLFADVVFGVLSIWTSNLLALRFAIPLWESKKTKTPNSVIFHLDSQSASTPVFITPTSPP